MTWPNRTPRFVDTSVEPMTVYVLDAWDDSNGVSTIEVYQTREKARDALKRYFENHPGLRVYAGIAARTVRG